MPHARRSIPHVTEDLKSLAGPTRESKNHKRIDYTLRFRHDEFIEFGSRNSTLTRTIMESGLFRTFPSSLHQLDVRHVDRGLPLFLSVKTKGSNINTRAVQLACVEITGSKTLHCFMDEGELALERPCLIVQGHIWTLYLVVEVTARNNFASFTNRALERNGYGIVLQRVTEIGGTGTILSAFRLLSCLMEIVDWGRRVYIDWFDRKVLGSKKCLGIVKGEEQQGDGEVGAWLRETDT